MATIAYTVDRLGQLRSGQIVELSQFDDIEPQVLQSEVDAWLPEGVTSHGERYLLRPSPALLFEPNVELICELVRRAEFPDAPSRFQSMFGCTSIAEAKQFLAEFGPACRDAQIFEVETDADAFKADMRCLNIHGSILLSSHGARRYWRQEPTNFSMFTGGLPAQPFWELLLRPPIRILRKVA